MMRALDAGALVGLGVALRKRPPLAVASWRSRRWRHRKRDCASRPSTPYTGRGGGPAAAGGSPRLPRAYGLDGNDPCFKVVISLLIVRNLSWILCQTCFLCSNRKASFTRVSTWRASGRSLFLRTTASVRRRPARIVLGQGGGAGRADPFRRGRLLPGEPGMPLRDGVGPGARAGRPSHLLEAVVRDGIAVHNGGGEQFLVSGKVNFDSHHAALLFDALPP